MEQILKGGVAICFSTWLDFNILSCVEIVRGRGLVVVVEIKKVPFSFINVYTPNSGQSECFSLSSLEMSCTMDRMNKEPS